jgi:hypothetical protein
MLCSNGHSKKISQFVDRKDNILRSLKSKIVYLHTEYEELHNAFSLLANIGKRRDYCIRQLETDYILLIDADAKILDSRMFEIINAEFESEPSEIYIYKIKFSETQELPIFPIRHGTIDTLNYCISTKLAKKVGYPTTINSEEYGNDFWFFNRCLNASNANYIFIDRLFCQYNGNNTYVNLQTLIGSHDKKNIRDKLLISLKVFIYRNLLNPFGL